MSVATKRNSAEELAEAQQTFQSAFAEWRASRPEWARLTAGIRANRTTEDLRPLAAAAGLSDAELLELRQLAIRSRGFAAAAAELPSRQKQLDAIEREIVQAKTSREHAGASESDRLATQIAQLAERRRFLFGEFAAAQQAAACCRVAEQLGVL